MQFACTCMQFAYMQVDDHVFLFPYKMDVCTLHALACTLHADCKHLHAVCMHFAFSCMQIVNMQVDACFCEHSFHLLDT